MLDGLLLGKNPILPLGGAIRHASQNDPGHLQSGVSETNCESTIVRKELTVQDIGGKERTILHLGCHRARVAVLTGMRVVVGARAQLYTLPERHVHGSTSTLYSYQFSCLCRCCGRREYLTHLKLRRRFEADQISDNMRAIFLSLSVSILRRPSTTEHLLCYCRSAISNLRLLSQPRVRICR